MVSHVENAVTIVYVEMPFVSMVIFMSKRHLPRFSVLRYRDPGGDDRVDLCGRSGSLR